MAAKPTVLVAEAADQLAQDVATRLVATLAAAQRARGTALLVVTGGGILEQVMSALAALPSRDAVDWKRVELWWGDERFVDPQSPDRNDRAAMAAGLDRLGLDPNKVHPMPADDGQLDADSAAANYAAELAAAVPPSQAGADIPNFDVVLLGIGPDGHCASLFPARPGVYEKAASVIAVHDSPKPPAMRISLTFRGLDAANEVWLIAAGDSKADAVARALSGIDRIQVPAAGPQGRNHTLWLVDRAAAARLSPEQLDPAPIAG